MSTSMSGLAGRRFVKPVGGLAAALALVGALALTPLGTLAQSFITIFEPTQFAAVQVTPSDVQSMKELPDLNSYGTMTNVAQPKMSQATSAAAAQTATGLTIRVPSTLPAGVPSNVTYLTTTQGIATFTFSAAKASAAAAATHRTLPAMPSGVDGSTLRATIGPVVVAVYGGNTSYLNAGVALSGKRSAIAMARHAGRAASRSASGGEFPSLVIAQAPQPRVDSTGATVREIEDYLLQQPGISPSLASEIRAIGDPSSTLPIPIPISRATAQNVQVQGVSGLAIGDNTGIGSGVIWEKDGMVYGVVGTLTESQVLSIANSLH